MRETNYPGNLYTYNSVIRHDHKYFLHFTVNIQMHAALVKMKVPNAISVRQTLIEQQALFRKESECLISRPATAPVLNQFERILTVGSIEFTSS